MKLPAEWKQNTIGELSEFRNGNGFKPEDWKESGLPIIRIQNLNGSPNFNYYQGAVKESWIVNPGDLLYAWAGVKGVSFGPTIWRGSQGVLNQHIFSVSTQLCDRSWLYYALVQVTRRIETKAHGFKSSLLHVHKSEITDAEVGVPPLPEQKAIADTLSTWDAAIEKTERLIAAKEQILSSRREASFKKRDSSARVQLGSVTHESTARNDALLGRDSVMAVTKAVGMRPMREETIATSIDRYKVVQPNAFAYNPMRLNIGSIAMSHFDEAILVSPDYVVFECDKDKILPGLVDHLRSTQHWITHFGNAGNGGVRVRIHYDELALFSFWLPPIAEQKKVLDVLDLITKEIDLMKKRLDLMKLQKRGLMQKLLTGTWRVPVRIKVAT